MFQYFYYRKVKQFVTYLTESVNLDMIECAKGKDEKKILSSKKWKDTLAKHIDEMLPLFSYRNWQRILTIQQGYSKRSLNPDEDIRLNLEAFLKAHYKLLYQKFHMKTYAEYQYEDAKEVRRMLYIEDLVIRNHKGTAVIIFYQNGRRMAYCPEDGKRLIIENLDLKEESSILTLVEQKEDFWTSLKDKITDLFFEEE